MKRFRETIMSEKAPEDKNVFWLDISDNKNPLLKYYSAYEWIIVSGGGGGGISLSDIWQSLMNQEYPEYYDNKISAEHIPIGDGLIIDQSGNISVEEDTDIVRAIAIGSGTTPYEPDYNGLVTIPNRFINPYSLIIGDNGKTYDGSEDVYVNKDDIGLDNVTNDAQVKRSEMGAALGVATLGSDGKVPQSQLPSYVDGILEFDTMSSFPPEGEDDKIYVALDTNKTYRWGGSSYVEISSSLVIGTTTGTAFDGGSGYSHVTNNEIHVTQLQKNTWNNALSRNGGSMENTNLVNNLNADLLDGHDSTDFLLLSDFNANNIISTLADNPVNRAMSDSDGNIISSSYLSLNGGTMNTSNRIDNLNADLLDGRHATDFATSDELSDIYDEIDQIDDRLTSVENLFIITQYDNSEKYYVKLNPIYDGLVVEGFGAFGGDNPGGGGGGGSSVEWGPDGSDYVPLTVNGTSKNLLTAHQSLSGYATEAWVGSRGYLTSESISDMATQTWVGQQGYITDIDSAMVVNAIGYTPADASDLQDYALISSLGTMAYATATDYATVSSLGTMAYETATDYATVASLGSMSYEDASDYLALSGGTMENTELVSNLNAELLNGHSLLQLTSPISPRDFENGTLVTTSIDYSQSEGAAFYMEIAADTYDWDGNGPLLTLVQGYIYDNTIINYGVINLGHYRLNTLYAMNINGHLCFWWPRLSAWQSFRVGVYDSSAGDYRKNLVTSIEDSVKPNGTKEVLLTDSLFNSAFTTDNVASATRLETARSIWGQSFDGTSDVDGDITVNGNGFFSGNVGIGVQSPSNELDVAGVIHATTGIYSEGYGAFGGVGSSSDERLKDDIGDIQSDRALSVLMRLKPKEWTWNDLNVYFSGRKGAGLVAQEVEEILPFAVIDEGEYKSLTYSVFHAYEIAGLQNHEARIVELEKKIEAYATR